MDLLYGSDADRNHSVRGCAGYAESRSWQAQKSSVLLQFVFKPALMFLNALQDWLSAWE